MLGFIIILLLVLFILTLFKPAKGLFWIPNINKRSRWFSLLYLLAIPLAIELVPASTYISPEERDHKRSVKMKLKKHQINTSALSDEDIEFIYDSLSNKDCVERKLDDIRKKYDVEPILIDGDFEFNYHGHVLKASEAFSHDPNARAYDPNDNCTDLYGIQQKLSTLEKEVEKKILAKKLKEERKNATTIDIMLSAYRKSVLAANQKYKAKIPPGSTDPSTWYLIKNCRIAQVTEYSAWSGVIIVFAAGNNSFQCKVNGDNIEGGKDEYIAKLATLRNGDVVDIRASVDEVSIGEWSNQINLILRGDIVWK